MGKNRVLEIFAQTKAIIKNSHIIYASGLHGSDYVNKDAVYRDPEATDELCQAIAEHFQWLNNLEVVVAPVEGGINLSQGVARHLRRLTGRKIISIFADKEGDTLVIRRGYDKDVPERNILVVDDIFTTGGSVKKLIELIRSLNGRVIGVGGLCDRGGVTAVDLGKNVPEPFVLIKVQMATYLPDKCPLCKAGIPFNMEVGKAKERLAQ
ncbi:MAG: phosphoribosyltransferase family protein [Candidatus Nealsonbacteria bacterium]